MSEQKQILEQYLKAKFSDKKALSILQLDKLADGWESDNYRLTLEYGLPPTRADWVLRIYSGAGSQEKAVGEFASLGKLSAAGYPVPQVFLVETEHSPVDRPFILQEFIPGEVMWRLLDRASGEEEARLLDQFCRLFVQLHTLDWKQFDEGLPHWDPFFYIDRWLDQARGVLSNFPEVDASPFLEWVEARRGLLACQRPSPVHQDFHPGNILIQPDHRPIVIDWTNFEVTDPRFDLAWTLILTHAHGKPGWRDRVLEGYQRHAGRAVEQIEIFEAMASARRLLDLTVSLTQGAQRMGMNPKAVEAMRASMEAHRRVYRIFIKYTGVQIKIFENLFGKME